MDESRIDALEERVKSLEKENRLLFRYGWFAVLVLNFFAACKITYIFGITMGRFRKMFVELLAGEPLPMTTEWCIALGKAPVALAVLVLIGLAIWGLLGSRKHLVPLVGVGLMSWFLLMVLAGVGANAQFAPLMQLIERLG